MSISPSDVEWVALVREGCTGNASGFQLRLSRLIARLRREGQPLAVLLSSALAQTSDASLTLARDSASQSATLSPVDVDSNLPLTTIQYPVFLEHQPVWNPTIENSLKDLIDEWTQAHRLLAAGLHPSRTVLLSGPPGVGKTLAATFLAQKLSLPLVTLNLGAAINSFLGKTGNNLIKVLNHAQRQPCVLLLDEFDAFAKRRDDGQDIGELKRVVNVLLQAIDEWPSTSLLVAATNHEELLDRAVFRRFDVWLRFPSSSKAQIETLLMQLGCDKKLASLISPTLKGLPLSDATRLVNRARRQVALRKISFEQAMIAASTPATFDEKDGPRYLEVKRLMANGKSMREIGAILKISASTVSRMVKKQG